MYLVGPEEKKIYSLDADGENLEVINLAFHGMHFKPQGGAHFLVKQGTSIAVYEDYLYISEITQGRIYKLDKFGRGRTSLVHSGLRGNLFLDVYSSNNKPKGALLCSVFYRRPPLSWQIKPHAHEQGNL